MNTSSTDAAQRNEHEPSEPQTSFGRVRRILKTFVCVILIAAALFGIRFAFGLIAAAWHYRVTPNFREYIANQPVSSETIEKRLPQGALLSSERDWAVGTIDPLNLGEAESDYSCHQLLVEIKIRRDVEPLLEFQQCYSVALRKNDWSHHGIVIQTPTLHTAKGLQAIVVTTLSDPDQMIGEESEAVGTATVDVYLIASEALSQTQYRLVPEDQSKLDALAPQPTSPISLWQLITGIPYNPETLPSEGLIHHVRQPIRFDWEKFENGHGGPSMSILSHAPNTHEYSYDLSIEIYEVKDGETDGAYTQTRQLTRRWNGEIW